jgi:hypothetical protein
MGAILAFLFSNPTILAIGAGVIAVAGAFIKGRLSGAKIERNKQAAEEAKARDISDQVQNDVGALPADAARKELGSHGIKIIALDARSVAGAGQLHHDKRQFLRR